MEQQPLLEHRRDEERAEVELKDSYIEKTRAQARWLLKSKFGHYGVLFLVCCDVAGSFTYILISLYLADHECEKPKKEYQALHDAQDALSIIALVFSCLFMAELTTSIWAFGFRYFKAWFHCLDAAVILAGFAIDVATQGVIKEVGTTVVILRLWRVLEIIEELSSGAKEQMDSLFEHMEQLEADNEELKQELAGARGASKGGSGNGS